MLATSNLQLSKDTSGRELASRLTSINICFNVNVYLPQIERRRPSSKHLTQSFQGISIVMHCAFSATSSGVSCKRWDALLLLFPMCNASSRCTSVDGFSAVCRHIWQIDHLSLVSFARFAYPASISFPSLLS